MPSTTKTTIPNSGQNPNTRKPRVSFEPTDEQWEQIKQLPRDVNLSEEMRACLDKLLAKHGVVKSG